MGTLLDIAIHRAPRGEMIRLEEAWVTPAHGVADDFRGSPGWRQITVVSHADWEAVCGGLGTDLDWVIRRANLLIDGIELQRSTGQVLCIGEARLVVTGESRPCERMDAAHHGLREALSPQWRGGVCCRVAAAGRIRAGDTVSMEPGGA
ncbi:MAG: MOSC domain-containing protein [Acidobacteriota bacterium]